MKWISCVLVLSFSWPHSYLSHPEWGSLHWVSICQDGHLQSRPALSVISLISSLSLCPLPAPRPNLYTVQGHTQRGRAAAAVLCNRMNRVMEWRSQRNFLSTVPWDVLLMLKQSDDDTLSIQLIYILFSVLSQLWYMLGNLLAKSSIKDWKSCRNNHGVTAVTDRKWMLSC